MKRYYSFGVIVIFVMLLNILMPCSSVLAGPDDEVTIPDAGLSAAIASEIGPAPFTEAALSTIIELSAFNKGISDLTGLEYCTNLEYLYLKYNDITDISLLSGLTKLKELGLAGNNILDVSALSGLTNLQGLDLTDNGIADISALSGLTNMVYLDLLGNGIADISALSGLTDLAYLDLFGNDIADISVLSGLTELRSIGLGVNGISDISALSGLTGLEELDLGDNDVSDISVLSGLTGLEQLSLGDNNISDITALEGLTSIRNLYLGSNNIADIKPLVDNNGLGWGDFVDLRNNPLNNVSIQYYIPELEDRWVILFHSITVSNEPPEADAGGPYNGYEGDIVTLDGSVSSDPDDNISLYEWDLDDDGQYDDATGETTTAVFSDNGVYTIGLRVTDSYEESATATATVTVANRPPDVDAASNAPVNLGDLVTVNAAFTDPGVLDTHTANISWGDGSIEPQTVDEGNGSGTFTGSHLYAWPGTYEVTVTVADNDLEAGGQMFSVEVLPVPDEMIETISDVIGDLELPQGKNESTDASLDTALAVLEDSNPQNDDAAINILEALINKIEAWRGKKISEADADALIAKLLEIIAALGGGE